jgi:hypothetical protein
MANSAMLRRGPVEIIDLKMAISRLGLVTFYVLFIIRLSTRSVHIAGVTTTPNGAYMKQVARNLTDVGDGFLYKQSVPHNGPRYTGGPVAACHRAGIN